MFFISTLKNKLAFNKNYIVEKKEMNLRLPDVE